VKESTFISKNREDWEQLESLLQQPEKDADQLLHLFEKTSGDLAYARTYYPNRSIKVYLNNLTQEVLNTLVKKREKFKFRSIIDFYKNVLPAEVYRSRKAFYTSFFVFALAVIIGAVSSANMEDFSTVVLGEKYINMTKENINDGDPMAVYKDMDQGNMFMMITINNIKVSFFCFVMGLLGSVGTIIILLMNGIMVGAFQYFFYKQGLFLTSFLTIWIHGTIEISSIILAGAAGIILGNGLMFPRSYTRNTSVLLAAKRALRIILALVPLFVIAGFLESFVTRLTDMPMIIKVLIIAASLLFILLTFVVYPIYCSRNGMLDMDAIKTEPIAVENFNYEKYSFNSLSTTISAAIASMRNSIGPFLSQIFLPSFITIGIAGYLLLKFKVIAQIGLPTGLMFSDFEYKVWSYGLVVLLLTNTLFVWLMLWSQNRVQSRLDLLKGLKEYFIKCLPFSLIFFIGFFYLHNDYMWVIFLAIPIHFIFIMMEDISSGKKLNMELVTENFGFSFRNWFSFLPITLVLILYIMTMLLAAGTPVFGIVIDFISWHDIFNNTYADSIYVNNLLEFITYFLPIPLLYFAYTYRYASILSLTKSNDLQKRLEKFGQQELKYKMQK